MRVWPALCLLSLLSAAPACHPAPPPQPPLIHAEPEGAAAPPAPRPDAPAQPVGFSFRVEIDRDHEPRELRPDEALAVGERLALQVLPEGRMYLYVLHAAEDGQTALLFPGPQDRLVPLPARAVFRVPPAGEWYQVPPGTGAQALHLFSSSEPVSEALLREHLPAATPATPAAPVAAKRRPQQRRARRPPGGAAPAAVTDGGGSGGGGSDGGASGGGASGGGASGGGASGDGADLPPLPQSLTQANRSATVLPEAPSLTQENRGATPPPLTGEATGAEVSRQALLRVKDPNLAVLPGGLLRRRFPFRVSR